jgi:hypothetical protein
VLLPRHGAPFNRGRSSTRRARRYRPLQKNCTIRERIRTQCRAEFYDAPNHLSWWGVGTTFGSSNLGHITSATDPRTLQFGLRLGF